MTTHVDEFYVIVSRQERYLSGNEVFVSQPGYVRSLRKLIFHSTKLRKRHLLKA